MVPEQGRPGQRCRRESATGIINARRRPTIDSYQRLHRNLFGKIVVVNNQNSLCVSETDDVHGRPNDAALAIRKLTTDWEDPGYGTAEEAKRLYEERSSGIAYVNPAYSVWSDTNSDNFTAAVDRHRSAWFSRMSRHLRSGWRHLRTQDRLLAREFDLTEGTFAYDGVIIELAADLRIAVPVTAWRCEQAASRETAAMLVEQERPEAFSALKAGNIDELIAMADSEVDRFSQSTADHGGRLHAFFLPSYTVAFAVETPGVAAAIKTERGKWMRVAKRNLSKEVLSAIPKRVLRGRRVDLNS